jgi:hypothetical protein
VPDWPQLAVRVRDLPDGDAVVASVTREELKETLGYNPAEFTYSTIAQAAASHGHWRRGPVV